MSHGHGVVQVRREPGGTFSYGGTKYSVPASGWIELLAERDGKGYLAVSGKTLPLDVWPIDAFGTRTVPLQTAPVFSGGSEAISTIND